MAHSRLIGLLALAALAASCSGTEPLGYDFQKEEGEGEVGIWVHSGLYNREYVLHTPPGMSPSDQPRPLIVFLHGAGGDGENFRQALRADAVTDAWGFITVWPDGMERTWTVGCADECTTAEELDAGDPQFLSTLVRHLASELPVDTTRVYLMGFSQGGALAQLYACRGDIPLAGVAVVSAEMYRDGAVGCAPKSTFPYAFVYGTADPLAYQGGLGPGFVVLSIFETVDLWRNGFGCDGSPSEEFRPDAAGDFTAVSIYRFPGCAQGASVTLFEIHGGGHNWPGDTGPWPPALGARSRNLDATVEFLKIFGYP